jgi:hypothetical protein
MEYRTGRGKGTTCFTFPTAIAPEHAIAIQQSSPGYMVIIHLCQDLMAGGCPRPSAMWTDCNCRGERVELVIDHYFPAES